MTETKTQEAAPHERKYVRTLWNKGCEVGHTITEKHATVGWAAHQLTPAVTKAITTLSPALYKVATPLGLSFDQVENSVDKWAGTVLDYKDEGEKLCKSTCDFTRDLPHQLKTKTTSKAVGVYECVVQKADDYVDFYLPAGEEEETASEPATDAPATPSAPVCAKKFSRRLRNRLRHTQMRATAEDAKGKTADLIAFYYKSLELESRYGTAKNWTYSHTFEPLSARAQPFVEKAKPLYEDCVKPLYDTRLKPVLEQRVMPLYQVTANSYLKAFNLLDSTIDRILPPIPEESTAFPEGVHSVPQLTRRTANRVRGHAGTLLTAATSDARVHARNGTLLAMQQATKVATSTDKYLRSSSWASWGLDKALAVAQPALVPAGRLWSNTATWLKNDATPSPPPPHTASAAPVTPPNERAVPAASPPTPATVDAHDTPVSTEDEEETAPTDNQAVTANGLPSAKAKSGG
eukprot:CAMPEP_0114550832 /NCGR_PEP_ID=MMETSP0114-20121206/6279_1 /TAXON_ID=31324 /ORGANISM="Goniomonas sp, Strain m" /LENGTH=462 /DNA_ID=CAMNT_0001735623 /DNA_START=47 /DNA_END=1431 /DNA_ORIENTATION=-